MSCVVLLIKIANSIIYNMTKLLTALFLLATLITCGQPKQKFDKDKERIDNVCDTFMQKFSDGKFEEALEFLKPNTAILPSSIDSLKITMADQSENLFPRFGKMLSSEFIKEKKVKNFIAKRYYIVKFSKFFIKVDFTLYNSGNGWSITSFQYDEEPEDILD
jgi:hypothetical protein